VKNAEKTTEEQEEKKISEQDTERKNQA